MDFSLSSSILIIFLLKFFTHGLPMQEELYGIKYMNIKYINRNINKNIKHFYLKYFSFTLVRKISHILSKNFFPIITINIRFASKT